MHEFLFFSMNIFWGVWKAQLNISYKEKHALMVNTNSVYHRWMAWVATSHIVTLVLCVCVCVCTCARARAFKAITNWLFLNFGTEQRSTLFPQILPQSRPQLWIWLIAEKHRNRMLYQTKTDLNSVSSFEFFFKPVIFLSISLQPNHCTGLPSAQTLDNPSLSLSVTNSPRQKGALPLALPHVPMPVTRIFHF